MSEEKIGNICVTLKEGHVLQVGPEIRLIVVKAGGHGLGKAATVRVSAPERIKVYRVKNLDEPYLPEGKRRG